MLLLHRRRFHVAENTAAAAAAALGQLQLSRDLQFQIIRVLELIREHGWGEEPSGKTGTGGRYVQFMLLLVCPIMTITTGGAGGAGAGGRLGFLVLALPVRV